MNKLWCHFLGHKPMTAQGGGADNIECSRCGKVLKTLRIYGYFDAGDAYPHGKEEWKRVFGPAK